MDENFSGAGSFAPGGSIGCLAFAGVVFGNIAGMEASRASPPEWSREDADRIMHRFIVFVMLPSWFGAGLLDWYWHRITRIEVTAGPREAALHLAMMGEVAVPVLLPLFVEVNPGAIAVMATMLVAHELTVMWDVMYATPRRKVAPCEQHTHSFLEVMPFVTVAFATILHLQESALGTSAKKGVDWRVRRKRSAHSRRSNFGVLAAVGALNALPYLEELVRCARARRTLGRLPIPEKPPISAAHGWAFKHGAEGYEF